MRLRMGREECLYFDCGLRFELVLGFGGSRGGQCPLLASTGDESAGSQWSLLAGLGAC
jgi:hypothetical protein